MVRRGGIGTGSDVMKLKPVLPFEPIAADRIPQGEQWVYQIKWDGVRMLVYSDGTEVRLVNRRLNDRTMQYPELTAIRDYCTADTVILDGEVIALLDGKPSFQQVMRRDGVRKLSQVEIARRQVAVTYMIFDVLYYNGQWVTDRPLQERQQLLASIVRPNERVQLVANFPDGEALFQVAEQHELEGIVCKDMTSKYAEGGKDKRWQKKKLYKDVIAAVGGVTYRDGIVNAVLLGLYDDAGRFVYIGHAGAGRMTVEDWRNLTEQVKGMRIEERPFANVPERHKTAVWLRPTLTMKIKFLEWTSYGTLRQPNIQSFVDVAPAECTFEQV